MGSHPSSNRRGDTSNGSVGCESDNILRAENAKLLTRIATLEQLQLPREVEEENEKLRNENESLKTQLLLHERSLSAGVVSSLNTYYGNDSGETMKRDTASLTDFRGTSNNNGGDFLNLNSISGLSREIEGGTTSDISSCGEDKIGDLSPTVVPKEGRRRPRKISPHSIPSRMSDIDAYGQGLPLPDSEKLRKHIRRSKKSQRRHDSGNSTASSGGLSKEENKQLDNSAVSSSPERTDQKDVFLGVECLTPGSDEFESRSACSDTKEDLLM